MSGEEQGPPPEVPEEFADAYREAYRRALGHQRPAPAPAPAPAPPPRVRRRRPRRPRPRRPSPGRGRRALIILLGVLVVVLLLLAAYLLGRALSRNDHTAKAQAWDGPVAPVRIAHAHAGCTAPPGVDSAGNPVQYGAENAVDGVPDTAWRCPGSAHGVTMVLDLGHPVRIGEVGLIPGYAKTDPVSHLNRYSENNRITRVRWSIGGTDVVQHLDGSPTMRGMHLLRIPPTTASSVRLQIQQVAPGPRHTTAISEVRVAAVSR